MTWLGESLDLGLTVDFVGWRSLANQSCHAVRLILGVEMVDFIPREKVESCSTYDSMGSSASRATMPLIPILDLLLLTWGLTNPKSCMSFSQYMHAGY